MSDNPYNDCLQALMAAVKTLNYFKKDFQVGLNHEEVSSRGAEYWFISTPGSFLSNRLDGRDRIFQWQTPSDLYVRYTTEKESVPKMIAVRGAIIKLLGTPRILKNVNVKSIIVAGGNLVQDVPGSNPNFIIQPLTITIEQIVMV